MSLLADVRCHTGELTFDSFVCGRAADVDMQSACVKLLGVDLGKRTAGSRCLKSFSSLIHLKLWPRPSTSSKRMYGDHNTEALHRPLPANRQLKADGKWLAGMRLAASTAESCCAHNQLCFMRVTQDVLTGRATPGTKAEQAVFHYTS